MTYTMTLARTERGELATPTKIVIESDDDLLLDELCAFINQMVTDHKLVATGVIKL